MALYTKKPGTVEAVQFFKPKDHPAVRADFDVYFVDGRNGSVAVEPGDWIIAEKDGRGFCPCKPHDFAAIYTLVSREADATGKPAITRAEADASLTSSTAPRVTVEVMEAKVASAEYFRFKTLTICILTLANDFMLVGKSACASPEAYDQATGERYAYDDAFRQIWAFEGYLLREKLAAA